MASLFTPSKRPFEPNPSESSGGGKWRKTESKSQQAPLEVTPGAVTFRILCPASKRGSVIGIGGRNVTKIRNETGASVRIEETLSGCEETVIVITGSYEDAEGNKDNSKTNEGESKEKDEGENERKDVSSVSEVPKLEKGISSAEKALLLVFERIVSDEKEHDASDEESAVTVRLLIHGSQIGCLIGKGGNVIRQMSTDTGAQIRILPKDETPLCASPQDGLVQIKGRANSAMRALQSVSRLLLVNPPHSFPVANPPGLSSHPFASVPRPKVISASNSVPVRRPPFPNRYYDGSDIPPPFSKFHESTLPGQIVGPPQQLIIRLFCPNDKIGSVLGKSGSVVKSLRHETGAEIKVLETIPKSDDRIIFISSPVLPGDQISPAQDCVLRVLRRIVMAVPDNKESTILSLLLVSAHQASFLRGKGGAVMAEMRRLSGAHICILSKDQRPKTVPENDEVVQITGGYASVQEALLHITGRLKIHLFRDKMPAMSHSGHPALVDQMRTLGPYMGRRETSPTRMLPNLPPFQREIDGQFSSKRSAFTHAPHGSVVPPLGAERIPVPLVAQDAASMSISEYAGGVSRRRTRFACENNTAVITDTTTEVVVPRAVVPAIYGEDGYCLMRIREISEAKITITEPRPEATQIVIIISGSPEQTHAAQSLLQAFVLSETCAS